MTDLITKEWQQCWDAMRDVGDEAAAKLLSALIMKDRYEMTFSLFSLFSVFINEEIAPH
jgi:hypothetical protein